MNTDEAVNDLLVNDALVRAVIKIESAGKTRAVSHCGAKGLMQLMDATGREWHEKLGIKEPYDPFNAKQNVTIGKAYLDYLIKRFKSIGLGLAAYNCGPSRVTHAVIKAPESSLEEVSKHIPLETRIYVQKVLAEYESNMRAALELDQA